MAYFKVSNNGPQSDDDRRQGELAEWECQNEVGMEADVSRLCCQPCQMKTPRNRLKQHASAYRVLRS